MPVLAFVTAFAGQIPASDYDYVLSRVASHGIVVVAADEQLGFALTLDYHTIGANFQKVINYIQNNAAGGLLSDLQTNKFQYNLYEGASQIFMGGHSSGAHVVLQNLVDSGTISSTCTTAGGIIMLSPMDGQDPLGFGGQFVVPTDGLPLPIVTPGLLVSGSLDNVASALTPGAPCTPSSRGDIHFYNAWQGGINLINAIGMGTLDILDEGVTTTYTQFCAASNASEVSQRAAYRDMVSGAIVTFMEMALLNSNSYRSMLTSQTYLNFPATTQQSGLNIGFSCSWNPDTPPMPQELQIGLILFGVFFAVTFLGGLYCFFRRMDDDTLHRYHPTEGIGYDQPASFKTRLEPQYSTSQQQQSLQFNRESRVSSVNI